MGQPAKGWYKAAMRDASKAYVYTSMTILGWGGAATAFELALRHITPLQLLLHSVLISLLVLIALLVINRRLAGLAGISARHWLGLLALGALNPFAYYLILFEAYNLLPGQVAMSLNYLWPMMLALLSVPLLGQRLPPIALVAIGFSFGGALLIATRGDFSAWSNLNLNGVALALVSTLVWATYWLLNARLPQDATIKLAIGFCSGSLLAWTYAGFSAESIPELADLPWLAVGYVGVLEMGLTFYLWLKALQLAPSAARIGHFIYLTPFLSLLFLALFVGEPIHSTTVIGLLIIVGGITMQKLVGARQRS